MIRFLAPSVPSLDHRLHYECLVSESACKVLSHQLPKGKKSGTVGGWDEAEGAGHAQVLLTSRSWSPFPQL